MTAFRSNDDAFTAIGGESIDLSQNFNLADINMDESFNFGSDNEMSFGLSATSLSIGDLESPMMDAGDATPSDIELNNEAGLDDEDSPGLLDAAKQMALRALRRAEQDDDDFVVTNPELVRSGAAQLSRKGSLMSLSNASVASQESSKSAGAFHKLGE